MSVIKTCVAHLPDTWQAELKRFYYKRQIKHGRFDASEPEYLLLNKFIRPGDWVIDIGANIGNYTLQFSKLTGRSGRVFAFEPVPSTFSLLTANMRYAEYDNITLINAAVSDRMKTVGMSIPEFSTGLSNFYQAKVTSETGTLPVIAISIDSFKFENRIALVKIDVEGHESYVISGMLKLIRDNLPVIIMETDSQDVIQNLKSMGYETEKLPDSPNILFKHC